MTSAKYRFCWCCKCCDLFFKGNVEAIKISDYIAVFAVAGEIQAQCAHITFQKHFERNLAHLPPPANLAANAMLLAPVFNCVCSLARALCSPCERIHLWGAVGHQCACLPHDRPLS